MSDQVLYWKIDGITYGIDGDEDVIDQTIGELIDYYGCDLDYWLVDHSVQSTL